MSEPLDLEPIKERLDQLEASVPESNPMVLHVMQRQHVELRALIQEVERLRASRQHLLEQREHPAPAERQDRDRLSCSICGN